MSRFNIKPTDRVHMLVWRKPWPSSVDDPSWRATAAVNGVPVEFGAPFATWREAIDYAFERTA